MILMQKISLICIPNRFNLFKFLYCFIWLKFDQMEERHVLEKNLLHLNNEVSQTITASWINLTIIDYS